MSCFTAKWWDVTKRCSKQHHVVKYFINILNDCNLTAKIKLEGSGTQWGTILGTLKKGLGVRQIKVFQDYSWSYGRNFVVWTSCVVNPKLFSFYCSSNFAESKQKIAIIFIFRVFHIPLNSSLFLGSILPYATSYFLYFFYKMIGILVGLWDLSVSTLIFMHYFSLDLWM